MTLREIYSWNRQSLMKPRITVAQIGARRHYAVPRFLYEAGLLSCFHTDIWLNKKWVRIVSSALSIFSGNSWITRLNDRNIPDIPGRFVHTYPLFATGRIWRRNASKNQNDLIYNYIRSNKTFCRLVIQHGLENSDTLYVFNGAGLELIQHAKKKNMKIILEQTSAPISYDEKILQEERKKWSGWEPDNNEQKSWKNMANREKAEWELADKIFCGSKYVVDAIKSAGGPSERCRVVPYGINSDSFNAQSARNLRSGNLRVLFLGTLQLRKGIPYLIEAAKLLKGYNVHIRAVGPSRLSEKALLEAIKHVEYIGPVPRSAVQQQYNWADLFILPTLSEGSANVCYEAMAMGLPVITTKNSGSVVRDGLDGYIVPIRSSESIVEKISQLASDRELVSRLSQNAFSRSLEFTWKQYAARLIAEVLS